MENTAIETTVIETPEAPEMVGTFKIVVDQKRTIKTSVSGQMIEALKRAKSPINLNTLVSRIKATKAGRELSVKDLKARVAKCADWYVKDENHWVSKTDDGCYFLTRV